MSDHPPRREYHLTVSDDRLSAVDLLAEHCTLSRQQIKQAMHKGAVWLQRQRQVRRLRRVTGALRAGDELHFYHDARVLAAIPARPDQVAEFSHYSVWYKPPGLLCQGSRWGDHCTLQRQVEIPRAHPCFVVHRLDRAARGLVLLAHDKRSATALGNAFQQRRINKHYQAWVHGTIDSPEQLLSQAQVRREDNHLVIDQSLAGKSARTLVRGVQACNRNLQCSLLELQLDTGRKHQLRQHLAGLGHPIVGDRLYGTTDRGDHRHGENDAIPDLQLCATRLAFDCPDTGAPRDISLPATLRLDPIAPR